MDDEQKHAVTEGGLSILDAAELAMGEVPLLGSIAHAGLAGKAMIDSWTTSDPRLAQEYRDEAQVQMMEAPPGIGGLMGVAREQQLREAARADNDPETGPAYTESGPDMNKELSEARHRVEIARSHGQPPDPADVAHMRQLEHEMGEGNVKDGPSMFQQTDPEDIEALYKLQQHAYEAQLEEQAKTGWRTKDGYAKPLDRPNMQKAIDEANTLGGWAKAKGYEVASPFLDFFGAGPKSDEELRAQEEEMKQFHYQ